MNNHAFRENGFVRLSQIAGDQKIDPPVPPIIPISKSTWCQGVKDGRFPKLVKPGPRITAWLTEEVQVLVEGTYRESRP